MHDILSSKSKMRRTWIVPFYFSNFFLLHHDEISQSLPVLVRKSVLLGHLSRCPGKDLSQI